MPRLTKAQQTERAEAIERLRGWLKPGKGGKGSPPAVRRGEGGTQVFCILRHVSASGMRRVIDICTFDKDGSPLHLGYNAALALDRRYDRKREGVVMDGCGMDMGFALVYDLAHVLFGDGYRLPQARWL